MSTVRTGSTRTSTAAAELLLGLAAAPSARLLWSTVNRSIPAQDAGPTTDRYVAMTPRRLHFLAALVAFLFTFAPLAASVATAGDAAADTTTHTPVMGPSLLTANQLAAWYFRHSGSTPQIPAFDGHPAGDVAALAQVFIDDGNAEGVRGDIAFVQSQLETGWMQLRRFADPARRVQLRGHLRVRRTSGPPELRARRLVAEPVHGNAATRCARADPTAAQLRRPVGARRRPAGSSPRRPTAPGERRCGSTSAATTARAAS